MQEIEESLRSHPFTVPFYLQNNNIQTLFHRFIPFFKTPIPKIERRYITLADSSQVATDCLFQKNRTEHPTVVIINGFTESSTSFSPRSISYKAFYYGFNVILLMQRGEGDTMGLTKHLFTAYPQYDLPIALDAFSEWGLNNIYLIGFSLGGFSILLTLGLLGEKAKNSIKGAVGVSVPPNVIDTWNHIDKNFFYNWLLLQGYKLVIKRRAKVDPPGTWDLNQLKKIKTKRQFFEAYKHTLTWSSPSKIRTLEEYDNKINMVPYLKQIQIPTLIINSYDDPVSPIEPFIHLHNPNVIPLLTKYGGHCGFFMSDIKYGDVDRHWGQNRAIEFIRYLNSTQNK